jgi:membrane-bound metal-dependent hydrolase YbcI (DUF457 family)
MMFAIGHFALGYLTGKASQKIFNTKINLPLLLVASVIPDVDLILQIIDPTLFMHRGPTHSIVVFTVFMIPFFIFYRKQAIPYYAALLSHSLIGDLPTGGLEMLWPISSNWYGSEIVAVNSTANALVELVLFLSVSVIMLKVRDFKKLLDLNKYTLFLLIAAGAVLGPMLEITQGSGSALPILLIPPSIFWLILFAYSILNYISNRRMNV